MGIEEEWFLFKCFIKMPKSKVKLLKLWDNDEIYIEEKNKDKMKWLTFPSELLAVLHPNKIEFIYLRMLSKTDKLRDRSFDFIYLWRTFHCAFVPTSPKLSKLLKCIRIPIDPTRDLTDYWIYYNNKDHSYDAILQDREPYSFVVNWNFKDINIIDLSKSLNFYMSFFDRKNPRLVFIEPNKTWQKYIMPCLFAKNEIFNTSISWNVINPVLIDISEAASEATSVRLKYIFYFQILEYAWYYFLANDINNELQNILCNPDISFNSLEYSKIIIEKIRDNVNVKDSDKMAKAVKRYVTFDDIYHEISCNIDYFSQDINFDWWFEIKAILDDKVSKMLDSSDSVKKSVFDTLLKNIDSIRNVLVHARESRENKVILPTKKNEKSLLPYLYLLRRISEYIMIRGKN